MSRPKQVGLLLLAVMVGVWAVRSFVVSDDTAEQTPANTMPPGGSDPDLPTPASDTPDGVVAGGAVAGIPARYPHTEPGAATAAVNWVASFPTIVRMGPIRLDDTLNQLLSAHLAATGTNEVVTDYFALVDELGPDFTERVWIESPLQATVTSPGANRTEVAVWASLITGDLDTGPIEVAWRTHHLALVWERDDWRIDNITITEGPTPIPTDSRMPSPPSEFAAVDGWEPAVFADTTIGPG